MARGNLMSNSFWRMSQQQLKVLAQQGPGHINLDIGDVVVVCHTSNQSQLLKRMIESAHQITNKVIILDDCSQDDTINVAIDMGCEVHKIPEGWMYTHGFGQLIQYQQSLCRRHGQYHLQLDTGEYLYLDPKITCALDPTRLYYWTLRINLDEAQFRQPMLNRLFRSDATLTFPTVIHGSPLEPQEQQHTLLHAEFVIFHHNNIGVKDSYYKKRKNRLYWKLLQKGYEQDTLHNRYWEQEWVKNKNNYLRILKEIENEIGILEETQEGITLVHKGDW